LNNYEEINHQKDFSISKCVWNVADTNSNFMALIFKIEILEEILEK